MTTEVMASIRIALLTAKNNEDAVQRVCVLFDSVISEALMETTWGSLLNEVGMQIVPKEEE